MKIDSKKLAYGFLAICIGITGYLFYDTFRIATDDSGSNTDGEKEVILDPGEIIIDFNDYEIEEKVAASLIKETEDSNILYLYENEAVCDSGAFDASNDNLLASITFSGVPDEYVISNVSVFKRTIEGNNTEISSLPTKSFELNTEETEDGGLKGSLKFVWEDRVIEGEFDAQVCGGSGTQISNFEECVAAGFPVMESYPRQCATDDGQSFTEDI